MHACLLCLLGWLHPVSESDPAAGGWQRDRMAALLDVLPWLGPLPILCWSPPTGALNPADWTHRIISEFKARHTVIAGKRNITDQPNSSSHHKASVC